jgi:adenine phosphoribosyltransferase
VAIVDDVVSTGGTLTSLTELLGDVGARVVATLVVFTEGDVRDDVVALGHLPLFPSEGRVVTPGTGP